ncbi:PQQ-like beta-propeller repeat protein [candidate division KSB1 bacterium]|nr:PQQ-like beta-propeller repeat protein [candidate division KSB1 bacterium]
MKTSPRIFYLCLFAIWGSFGSFIYQAADRKSRQQDWPQWRGPNRDGISTETGLLKSWPANGPKIFWKKAIGDGFSAVSVVGDRLYTAYTVGDNEVLFCLNANDGNERWRFRLNKNFIDEYGNGPRATPTVDNGVVYAMGSFGMLYALEAINGRKRWEVDLHKEFGHPKQRNYGNAEQGADRGYSSSPLIEGDLLITNVGRQPSKTIVAFNKHTGKLIWTSQTAERTFASPIAASTHGKRHLIGFTGEAVVGLSPQDGKELWKFPWSNLYYLNIATPVFLPPDKVFVSCGFDQGAVLLKISSTGNGWTAQKVWSTRRLKNELSSSIFYQDHLYGFDNTVLKCLDAGAGEEKWRTGGLGQGSLILADQHLIVLSEKGELALIEATPSAYKEKARAQILSGKCWTMPVLAGGKLYLRNQKEMVCLDMTGKF